jgi:hypothetical protein
MLRYSYYTALMHPSCQFVALPVISLLLLLPLLRRGH